MKPLSVIYSKEARLDLHSIFDYIQLYRPSAAEDFLDTVHRAVQRITMHPRSGSLARDKKLKTKGYRYIVIDEYLMFYRCSNEKATILRFVHGRRHYVPLLLS